MKDKIQEDEKVRSKIRGSRNKRSAPTQFSEGLEGGLHPDDSSEISTSKLPERRKKMKVKSKVLLYDVLARINRNESLNEIRKWYGWRRQRLYYYIAKLKKSGIISLKTRDSIAFYELTDRGKVFLDRHLSYLSSGIRLHNVEFIANIISLGSITPDKEWSFNHTLNQMRRESDCSVIWNHKSIRFLVSNLFGSNSYELFDKAKTTVENLAKNLEMDFGLKIGELSLNRKPHFAIKSPLVAEMTKSMEIDTEEGKMDESEGLGEIDWYSAEGADRFLKMPKEIEELKKVMMGFATTQQAIANTQLMMAEILKELNKTLEGRRTMKDHRFLGSLETHITRVANFMRKLSKVI